MARPRKAIRRKDRIIVINRDKLKCIQCDTSLYLSSPTSLSNGSFHHIIPLVYGGENIHFNICSLCTECHNKTHSGDEVKQKYFDMSERFIKSGLLWEAGQ